MKITIIYWTSTGNTEKMAKLIESGLKATRSNDEIVVKRVDSSSPTDLLESDMVVLGCSAMGVEEIDSSEMEPFILVNKELFNNKPIALFGSYGWGDGEWMESWEAMMDKIGGKRRIESLIINETPDGQTETECIEFGQRIGLLDI